MNIGILTLSLHGNIGGILQNYALSCVLRSKYGWVETIDFKPDKHQRIKCLVFRTIKRLRLGLLVNSLGRLFSPKFSYLFNLRCFIDENICMSQMLSNLNEIEKECTKLDVLVVGSDQCWRKIFISNYLDVYFCDFKNSRVKLVSYASSLGVDELEYNENECDYIKTLMGNFSEVSVREKNSVDVIANVYKWYSSPIHVLDPTMLLDVDVYDKLIKKAKVKSLKCQSLFYYILDLTENKMKCIQFLCSKYKARAYTMYPTGIKKKCYCNLKMSIEQWLVGIKDAEVVFTDSFHGVCFCILYNKQFFVYGNKERGNMRIESLLSTFGLEDRIITSYEDLISHKIKTIDYTSVNIKLENMRNISFSFLDKCFKR